MNAAELVGHIRDTFKSAASLDFSFMLIAYDKEKASFHATELLERLVMRDDDVLKLNMRRDLVSAQMQLQFAANHIREVQCICSDETLCGDIKAMFHDPRVMYNAGVIHLSFVDDFAH